MSEINTNLFEQLGTLFFILAILHTFLVKQFQKIASRYPEGSIKENLFHLFGEVEVVFGLWAGIFILSAVLCVDLKMAMEYLNTRDYKEALFVFVIMVICSTKPILELVRTLISVFAKLIPLKRNFSIYLSCMLLGPILGSFITEPAAMTVTALFLLNFMFRQKVSNKAKYLTLGLLFVNISIGGTLTPFAAPPVLMVAGKWNWDLFFMLTNFGWKAGLSILLSTLIVMFFIRKDLKELKFKVDHNEKLPMWVIVLHILFLVLVVLTHTQPIVFFGLFLFFLGLVTVTKEFHEELKLKESLLVAFFLGGLVVLGGPQKWWLQGLISHLSVLGLYFGSIGLTSFTDNAALTFLGSQVENLSDLSKYALVAGSVVGGGLTVIANAPNPAGYSILNGSFGEQGIAPLYLFLGALLPTAVAALFFFPY
ncbi:MAG: putative Na+/H+ antiporter [Bdellovibrionaceae bacterium]|nr:putative Na+/H+ antiporter [Pseudobdellovibrionaceae bacterium]NUM60380.1 putative Na+/H+ antiporter [Pseudobdellovibrionaceae bacterium]